MTEQRKLIYDVLHESSGHMTADQIYSAARLKKPDIAMGTVYRNLKLMSAAGEIRHIAVAGGSDIYDKTVTPHEHTLCEKCGAVCDICDMLIAEKIEQASGAKVISYELTVHGICPTCLAEV